MDEITIKRRNLPHWTMNGAVYFVTSCTNGQTLSEEEQKIVLEHIRYDDENIIPVML